MLTRFEDTDPPKDLDEELIETEPLGVLTDAPLKNELTPVGNAGRASLLISKEAA